MGKRMMRQGFRMLVGLWMVWAFLCCGTQAQGNGAAMLTLPEMPLHDPWILANEADQTYYLYTSNVPAMSGVQGAGTMVYRSKDLKHWEKPVLVFRKSAPAAITVRLPQRLSISTISLFTEKDIDRSCTANMKYGFD